MRLFVAVPVPEELREKLALVGKELGQDGVSLVRAGNMHLTLKFIGDVQPQAVDEIKRKLGEVRFRKFSFSLRGVGAFPSEEYIRVVWAGGESGEMMEALAQDVITALKGYGKDERFTAHLTLARVKKKLDLKGFFGKRRDEEFGSFEVSRFELIESVLGGPKGPEYRTLAVFESQD